MNSTIKVDKKNKFISTFNPVTGFYMRSGILNEDGKDTNVDPFMSSFPELIDIGIMGFCKHSKYCTVGCYQGGDKFNNKANMLLSDYKKIIDEGKGKLFQVALGGHGDPDEHENFLDILKYTRENNIVPNFTTSGFNFNDRKSEICKEFCGAVAVSHYSKEYTRNTIHSLLRHGVKTNIHFVLSEDTIDEAIAILEPNEIIDKGINAIIFLMHKPVGLGSMEKVLKTESKIQKFFELVDNYKPKYEDDFKIGFDSCSIPAILNYTKNINKDSIDTCEGARWSMYITADMKALPCSFDQDHKWAFDIKSANIKDAWESDQFNDFRNYFLKRCPACYDRINCMGGCPIKKEIVLCQRPQRSN